MIEITIIIMIKDWSWGQFSNLFFGHDKTKFTSTLFAKCPATIACRKIDVNGNFR